MDTAENDDRPSLKQLLEQEVQLLNSADRVWEQISAEADALLRNEQQRRKPKKRNTTALAQKALGAAQASIAFSELPLFYLLTFVHAPTSRTILPASHATWLCEQCSAMATHRCPDCKGFFCSIECLELHQALRCSRRAERPPPTPGV